MAAGRSRRASLAPCGRFDGEPCFQDSEVLAEVQEGVTLIVATRLLREQGVAANARSGTVPRSPAAPERRCSSHLVGVVAGPDERAAGDLREPQRAGHSPQFVELFRREIPHHREMARRRLQVLAHGEQVATVRTEVGQGLQRPPRSSRPARASGRSWFAFSGSIA